MFGEFLAPQWMKWVCALGLIAAPSLGLAFGGKPQPALPTVAHVDIQRYLGTWYEIARLPQKFQEGCAGVTAKYDLRDDGSISVLNRCLQGGLSGRERTAEGIARIVDPVTNAKLEVSFFRPFWGDYWILELGADYEYAVVGVPDRGSLWILSRTPQMDPGLVEQVLARRQAQGFDISRMEYTLQERP